MIRVFIADDHSIVRSGIRRLLEDQVGIRIVGEAADGQEAVSLARQLLPDVVVMDVEMPNMDGLEASKYIDQEGLCSVILLSERGKTEWVQDACSLSAVQAYLVKPVNEENLEPAIELALDRFQRIKELQRLKQLANISDIRSVLEQATEYLVVHRHCSAAEAESWIEQEARAKKASLDEVAKAIIAAAIHTHRSKMKRM